MIGPERKPWWWDGNARNPWAVGNFVSYFMSSQRVIRELRERIKELEGDRDE